MHGDHGALPPSSSSSLRRRPERAASVLGCSPHHTNGLVHAHLTSKEEQHLLVGLYHGRRVSKNLLVRLREPATGGLHTCVDETKRARELSPEAVSRRQWPVPRPSIAGQESFCDPRSISACGRSGCGACAKFLGQAHRASPPWRLWHGAAAKKASAGEVVSAEEKV